MHEESLVRDYRDLRYGHDRLFAGSAQDEAWAVALWQPAAY
jgi:hypothetical protein